MIFTKRYIIVFLGIIQVQTNASIRQKPITRLSTSSIRVQLTKNSQLERLDNSQLSSNGLSFLNHRGSTDSSNTSDLSDIFDETNNSYDSDFEEEEEEEVTIAPPKDLEEIDSLKSKYHEEIKKLSTLKAKIETTLKILNRLKKCHPDYHEEEEKDLYDPQNSSDESGLYNEDDGNIQSIRNQAIFEESLKKHLEKKLLFIQKKSVILLMKNL